MSLDAYPHVSLPPAPGAPLVFALHGTGGDERQFPGLVARILPGAGVVSPRGDVSEHGANRFFRRRAEGVYDMADLARATARMAGFVRAHRAAHPDAPAYAFGYSNGANILAAVLFAAPELFDRTALLHPLIPWAPAPQPGLRGREVLITAGERDPIGPLAQTRELAAWLRDQGAAVELTLHPGGHELRQEEIAALAAFLARPRGAVAA